MRDDAVPIFFTVDESYAPYLDCAIRSMIANADKSRKYRIIVLCDNVTDESKARIREGIRPPFGISFVDMKGTHEGLTDREENRLRCDYFTMTIYFRLFIPDLFPEYGKCIYLDSDVIVTGDISRLYDTELGDNLIGACLDRSIHGVPELISYIENAVGSGKDEYINSGVLLMNLARLRDLGLSEHFLSLLNKHHFETIAPDQDYLNAICKGSILYLDGRWDAMPPQGGGKSIPDPFLIHFNLFMKPWCYDDIPYQEEFWKWADSSPFRDDIHRHKDCYTAEDEKSDEECLRTLISKGAEIAGKDKTFRKMAERGERIRL